MWIKNNIIALRKLFFLLTLLIVLAVAATQVHQNIFWFIGGIITALLSAVIYSGYTNGLYRRVYTFTLRGEPKEIINYIDFKTPSNNYRGIRTQGQGWWDSRIYLAKRQNWKYLDIIRTHITSRNQKTIRSVLILGGGVGALAHTIGEFVPHASIDVVEISVPLGRVAKQFFGISKLPPRIRWLYKDAFQYVKTTLDKGKTYNYIVVDIFEGDVLPSGIYTKQFIHSLKQLCSPGGALFVNFGKPHAIFTQRLAFQREFHSFYMYADGKNIIGVTHPFPKTSGARLLM